MTKPRLLVPITLQFSVRYLLRSGLLASLAQDVQLVILLAWKDPELQQELEALGAEVHPLLEPHQSNQYDRIRSFINVMHVQQMNSPSWQIRERRADRDRTPWTRHYRRIRKAALENFFAMGGSRWVLKRESELFWSDTNAREVQAQIERLRPDAVFTLTPFLVEEDGVLRVCALQGIPMCTAILSFDNITTRGWIPVTFQKYLMWNRNNVAELHRGYPASRDREVEVVGAPQFDFYRDPSYIWDEATWRRRMGLPEGRPVILFGGGFYSCAPHEPHFLQRLDRAIEQGVLRDRPVILFRNHPVDPIARWQPFLEKTRNLVCDNPSPEGRALGRTNLRREDIERLASTLYHCRVHVNVASTMTVDGAFMDRPQVGPAYDDTPNGNYHDTTKELYWQEHYVPIAQSGGLDIAGSAEEYIAAVASGLDHPGRLAEGRRKIVREICTFDDGKAAARVARSVKAFLKAEEPVAEGLQAGRDAR